MVGHLLSHLRCIRSYWLEANHLEFSMKINIFLLVVRSVGRFAVGAWPTRKFYAISSRFYAINKINGHTSIGFIMNWPFSSFYVWPIRAKQQHSIYRINLNHNYVKMCMRFHFFIALINNSSSSGEREQRQRGNWTQLSIAHVSIKRTRSFHSS